MRSLNTSAAIRTITQQVVEKFFQLSDLVNAQPLIGRIVPELNNEHIRELFVYSYRVIYAIQPDQSEILAVLHGKRLLESIENRIDPDANQANNSHQASPQ